MMYVRSFAAIGGGMLVAGSLQFTGGWHWLVLMTGATLIAASLTVLNGRK